MVMDLETRADGKDAFNITGFPILGDQLQGGVFVQEECPACSEVNAQVSIRSFRSSDIESNLRDKLSSFVAEQV